jgi:hypothetical protein
MVMNAEFVFLFHGGGASGLEMWFMRDVWML